MLHFDTLMFDSSESTEQEEFLEITNVKIMEHTSKIFTFSIKNV